MEHYRVLVVDDDEALRKMLGRYLEHIGFETATAHDTITAIELMEKTFFDVVLADVRMPGPDGLELLDWIAAKRPMTAAVMLSGCDDVRLAVRAMKGGALDYVVKPFELKELSDTLGRAIGNKRRAVGRERYLSDLEHALEQQTGELRSTMNQLQEASEDTLEALTAALDARERETLSHSKRVSEYSARLAREMGISGTRLEEIRQGSMLHDIGKIGIPDRILLKPGELTEEEWTVMRQHPEIGAWIVEGVESLKAASGIVIAHHERFDGSGYPRGLRGSEIPLGARIFAVADTLDAVLSDRPYRSGKSYEHARREIAGNSGSQFDPEVTACWLGVPSRVWKEIREFTLTHEHSHLVHT